MSQVLLEALAASIPLAVLALLAAWGVEALGAGLRLRVGAWTAALLIPLLPAPGMLAIHALDIPSPFAAAAPSPLLAPLAAPALRTPAPAPPPRRPIAAVLLALAAAGAGLRLGQLALGLARVARLRAASQPLRDPDLAARLGDGVRLADMEAPVLAGLMRPAILLPRQLLDALTPEQAALVCAHERAHLAAGDHLWRLMEEIMVRLYWFNPFMTFARERLAAAREEACDARALSGCDAAGRRAYAQALLAALRLAGRAEPVAAFTGFRRRGVRRRLKAILTPSGPGSWRAGIAAVLAGLGLAAAAGGLSLAVAAQPETPSAPPRTPPAAPASAASEAAAAEAAAQADAAAPARPARRRRVVVREAPQRLALAERTPDEADGGIAVHAMVMDQDGGAPDERADRGRFDDLTPEERKQLKKDMDQARADVARAMRDIPSREDMARIQAQVEEAMTQARVAMERAHAQLQPRNHGRVLMRCKLGPDGKATDCQPLVPETRTFMLFRHGPGGPAEPAPPAPPAPPAG